MSQSSSVCISNSVTRQLSLCKHGAAVTFTIKLRAYAETPVVPGTLQSPHKP